MVLVIKRPKGNEFRNGVVHFSEGELYVIPKRKEHKPFSDGECQVLLIEPRGMISTGEAGGELEAENDLWV